MLTLIATLPLLDSTAGLLIDAAVKGVAIVAVALLVVLALRKQAAAWRHLVWSLTTAGLVALPILSTYLPSWQISVPASWNVAFTVLERPLDSETQPAVTPFDVDSEKLTVSDSRTELPVTSETSVEPAGLGQDPPVEAAATSKQFDKDNSRVIEPAATQPVVAQSAQAAAVGSKPSVVSPQITGYEFLKLLSRIWLAGVVLVAMIPLIGLCQVVRLRHRSRPLEGDSWQTLLEAITTELGIRRHVGLLCSSKTRMPLTWGILRPVVLLPDEAEEWSNSRRRIVLLHELAHVKRLDWLTQMICQMACALHWFNPLAWFVSRRMQVEREQACDDMVLAAGTAAADYASELLHFATRLRTGSLATLAAVPMARQTSLEQRVRGILDRTRRRASVTRIAMICGLAACCCILIPLAMLMALADQDAPVRPKAVQVEAKRLSAFYVHNDSKIDYAFLYVGVFNSSASMTSNSVDNSWQDDVTLVFNKTKLRFARDWKTPDVLKIDGLNRNLRDGRVFIIDAINAQPDRMYQVRQVDIMLPLITKTNIESVFATAHQPGFLPVSQLGFTGEYPPAVDVAAASRFTRVTTNTELVLH